MKKSKHAKKSAAADYPPAPMCQDKKCKCCNGRLVDRGYGYPVCPSVPRREYA
jgi:hypothetical protein